MLGSQQYVTCCYQHLQLITLTKLINLCELGKIVQVVMKLEECFIKVVLILC
jgi:hypothetical protein